jgi:hypothetical protein
LARVPAQACDTVAMAVASERDRGMPAPAVVKVGEAVRRAAVSNPALQRFHTILTGSMSSPELKRRHAMRIGLWIRSPLVFPTRGRSD